MRSTWSTYLKNDSSIIEHDNFQSCMKILFISAFHKSFIQDDIDVLEKHFTVRKNIGHGLPAIFKIIFNSLTADVVFCWFASIYAFFGVAFGRLMGLKSIVIVGGVDVANDKELGYGIWLNPWKARLVRYVFHHATHILVVDPSLQKKAIDLAGYDGRNISYLPTGYDCNFWKNIGEKESSVLTVAMVKDQRTFRLKGIDILIEVARNMPDVNFIVVGTDPDVAFQYQPSLNIKFIEPVPREQLLPFYQRSKVYCQPSRHEGLPNALCEAMLCGCIPVATEVGGSPTAVGDAGFLVPPADSTALMIGLRDALCTNESAGMKARARIVALFPDEKREFELVRLIRGERK